MQNINQSRSLFKSLKTQPRQKAEILFFKLNKKWDGVKAWDVIRSHTHPIKEPKLGADTNDFL